MALAWLLVRWAESVAFDWHDQRTSRDWDGKIPQLESDPNPAAVHVANASYRLSWNLVIILGTNIATTCD
jgi:hypothetical protein